MDPELKDYAELPWLICRARWFWTLPENKAKRLAILAVAVQAYMEKS